MNSVMCRVWCIGTAVIPSDCSARCNSWCALLVYCIFMFQDNDSRFWKFKLNKKIKISVHRRQYKIKGYPYLDVGSVWVTSTM